MRENEPRDQQVPAAPVTFMAPQKPEPDPNAEAEERAERQRAAAAAPQAVPVFAPPPKVERTERAPRADGPDEPDEGEPKRSKKNQTKKNQQGKKSKPAPKDPDPQPEEAADEVDESDEDAEERRRRRGRRGRRGRGRGKGAENSNEDDDGDEGPDSDSDESASSEGPEITRRRRRRRKRAGTEGSDRSKSGGSDNSDVVVKVRTPPKKSSSDDVRGVSGSTRLEAKRQRRRDGRKGGRNRGAQVVSEAEFLARRESVERRMVVRFRDGRSQAAVLEDGILAEHYVSRTGAQGLVGNVYLGKVQNVLPSMEAAFVDIGRGRNAVLYAGEVNWDATGLAGKARSIEQALKPGDSVLVQVTKDPVGHKGARLTSHIALSGRHLVYVPGGNASGISRKLPDRERTRLRAALKKLVPEGAGVIVRTAAEGAGPEDLARDISRLQIEWEEIQTKAKKGNAPAVLHSEPDVLIRVVRDVFNEDFKELVVEGDDAYDEIHKYLESVSPELLPRLKHHTGTKDVFTEKRVDEQLLKALDRKVYLPSGGSLVIDRTEAMTVIDVNTGRFTGEGGNLEETVTRNNLEAAEEIVRQLRLRDIGGIIVIDFIDMVLESNRDLVLRRLTECLGRDRTKHQVTEVTSLGLVQMTRKRVGQGLIEAFSESCDHCKGRGVLVHPDEILGNGSKKRGGNGGNGGSGGGKKKKERSKSGGSKSKQQETKSAAEPTAKIAAASSEGEESSEAQTGTD
ncbi:Rne/Rng family ribonuclease [Glycomyces xiaoerkulensis]|uniref:Rne/Rng family ribonuclease n=1 Tax=Glycomyces xiaoerkulensis TaxID=2038139 RepID=UPI000C268B3B|nr:Rne/Rng family ribonuclease [Glycomyces xiaoerkulensis]